MEWKRETKGWKQVEIPGFIQEGEAGGRRGKQRRRQPSKNRSKGNFSGKNGRLRGKMEKIASKTGKNGFGTGKKPFFLLTILPRVGYTVILQGFAPKGGYFDA